MSQPISQNPAYDAALDTVVDLILIATEHRAADFDEAVAYAVDWSRENLPADRDHSEVADNARLELRVALDVKNGFVSPRLGNVRELARQRVGA